jgi:hypothetical protein
MFLMSKWMKSYKKLVWSKFKQGKSAVSTAFQGNGDMTMNDRINGFKRI